MTNEKLRIGIIGCGGIANQKHLPSLKALSELCEMVAFCDIKEDRAVKSAAEYGVPGARVYTDYRELLKEEDIDVVHVLTPNNAHCRLTVDAFAAGKHVMCEKPMAATTEDAQKMIDAWKKSGKKFTIGYQNRFRPEVYSLHGSCEAGELGEIYFAKAHATRRKAVPTWGVFMDKEQQGGGPLIDIGTHALDMTLWMMNNYEPLSVVGTVYHKLTDQVEGNLFGPWDPKTYDVEDSAFGFIRMKNGASIFLEASWILNIAKTREAATTLCGTKAGAEILKNGSVAYYNSRHGILMDQVNSNIPSVAYFNGVTTTPGIDEAMQWLKAIKEDKDPLVLPEQAFVVTQILDGIYRSAKEGKEIYF